jgi:hypothetical protein
MNTTQAIELLQTASNLVANLPTLGPNFIQRFSDLKRTAPGSFSCGTCNKSHVDTLCFRAMHEGKVVEFCGPCILQVVQRSVKKEYKDVLPINVAPKEPHVNRAVVNALLLAMPDFGVTTQDVQDRLLQVKTNNVDLKQLLASQLTLLKRHADLEAKPNPSPEEQALVLAKGLIESLFL